MAWLRCFSGVTGRCFCRIGIPVLLVLFYVPAVGASDADKIARSLAERLEGVLKFEDQDGKPWEIHVDEEKVRARIQRLDCVPVDASRLVVRRVDGHYSLLSGRHWIERFGRDRRAKEAARWAQAAIRYYRPDRLCYIGRPNKALHFMLLPGTEPVDIGRFYKLLLPGKPPSRTYVAPEYEFCTNFSPARLKLMEIRDKKGRPFFYLESNGRKLWDFGDNQQAAEEALVIIRLYRFQRQCHLGRLDVKGARAFTYLKR